MKKTHYHCIVIGYDKEQETENGVFFWHAKEVELVGYLDEKDAIERAKKLVDAPNYVVRRVSPCFKCTTDSNG